MELNQTAQEEAVAAKNTDDTGVQQGKHNCDVTPIPFSFKTPLPEEFNIHITQMLHLAAHYLKDGEEVPLLFVGINANNEGHLIDPEGLPVRQLIRVMVRNILKEIPAVAVLMMTESWSLPENVAKDWNEGKRPEGMQIKDHPEAFEVVMVQIETINGTWGARAKLNPTVKGEPRTLQSDMEFEKATDVGGQFCNLLPQNSSDEDEHPIMQLIGKLISAHVGSDEGGNAEADTAKPEDGDNGDNGDGTKVIVIGV